MKCYICNKNNANTLEHIIPDGLKGRQKARILCHECNNKTGYMFDCDLIQAFQHHLALFGKKDVSMKLINTDIESTLFKGKIKNTTKVKNGVCYIVGDEEYANKQKLNMNLSENSTKTENPIIQLSHKEYDTLKYFIAVFKIATNFCVKNNISIPKYNAEYILKALNGEEVKLYRIINYTEYSPNEISLYNAIIICGNKEKNVIYAIVSIFSLSHIILLDDSYEGENFTQSYHYDLIEEKEKNINYIDNHNVKEELEKDNRLLRHSNLRYCFSFFTSQCKINWGKPNKENGCYNLLRKQIFEVVDEFCPLNSWEGNMLKKVFTDIFLNYV